MRSDADLVDAVLAGQPAAFATLVERYERAARAAAVGILRDHHAAQDATQEAFVVAYQKLATLRDGSAFSGWVLRIVRRHALRLARQRSKLTPAEPLADAPAPQRDGQLDEVSQQLLQAVIRLPEHERIAVMLRYFDGHAVQTIAEMTGRPVGTVTKQLSRAHARLREWLEDVER